MTTIPNSAVGLKRVELLSGLGIQNYSTAITKDKL